jgi:YD repeat-containing protein
VLGQQTRTTYDAQGRVLSSTAGYGSAQASTTSYAYDASGQVAWVTDRQGRRREFNDDAPTPTDSVGQMSHTDFVLSSFRSTTMDGSAISGSRSVRPEEPCCHVTIGDQVQARGRRV